MGEHTTAIRGAVLTYTDDPFQKDIDDCDAAFEILPLLKMGVLYRS